MHSEASAQTLCTEAYPQLPDLPGGADTLFWGQGERARPCYWWLFMLGRAGLSLGGLLYLKLPEGMSEIPRGTDFPGSHTHSGEFEIGHGTGLGCNEKPREGLGSLRWGGARRARLQEDHMPGGHFLPRGKGTASYRPGRLHTPFSRKISLCTASV